jgi:hypothetical protein
MELDERNIHWSPQLEDLIAHEGEKCRGLAWIHQHAEQTLSKKNNMIQIPVIVLSTLCGTASVGSSTLFGEGGYANIIIGLVSISVGVLNTLGNYFAYARKSEAHRIAYLHYSKLFSWVAVELSLPRSERMVPAEMLKQIRDEMERLAETTPSPPEPILNQFNKQFKDYKDVARPAETNGLQKILIYRDESRISSPLQLRIPESQHQSPAPVLREPETTHRSE